jgi:hypothetical protein
VAVSPLQGGGPLQSGGMQGETGSEDYGNVIMNIEFLSTGRLEQKNERIQRFGAGKIRRLSQ